MWNLRNKAEDHRGREEKMKQDETREGDKPQKIVNGRVALRGWLLADVEKDLRVAVKIEHLTYSFPFNIKRPDVISAILKQPPEKHQRLHCGFDINVPFSTKIIIGLESDDGACV